MRLRKFTESLESEIDGFLGGVRPRHATQSLLSCHGSGSQYPLPTASIPWCHARKQRFERSTVLITTYSCVGGKSATEAGWTYASTTGESFQNSVNLGCVRQLLSRSATVGSCALLLEPRARQRAGWPHYATNGGVSQTGAVPNLVSEVCARTIWF